MSFISWLLFILFGGIGLAALPLDFFYDFCNRPKHLKGSEIKERKQILLENCEDLRLLCRDVKEMENKGYNKKVFVSSDRREYNRKLNELKAGVLLVDKEFNFLDFANQINQKGSCALCFYYLLIPLGIICLIITGLWILQFFFSFIYTENGRPKIQFISYFLLYLEDHNVAFLSFFFFSLFCLYLLFCTMKGNIKFGLRIFIFSAVHPMKKDETYMNSFLFNVSLILISSVSVTQFCANAFSDYVTFTDIDLIFGVQIKYLRFFVFFYKNFLFEYAFIIIFALSFLYLLIRPNDPMTTEKMFEEKEKNKKEKEFELAKVG